MKVVTVSATEIKNYFGKYLDLLITGHEIIVTKNGSEVGRFLPKNASVSFLTDSLIGVLKKESDPKKTKVKALEEKYGLAR